MDYEPKFSPEELKAMAHLPEFVVKAIERECNKAFDTGYGEGYEEGFSSCEHGEYHGN